MQDYCAGRVVANSEGNYRILRDTFERYVQLYQKCPDFCVPVKARQFRLNAGKAVKVVLLGTKPFASLFIQEASERVDIVGVVDDFEVGSGKVFHGIPIISSAELVDLARNHEVVCVNSCRYDYSRRYFKNLALRHGISMLNFEQAIRWLEIETCTDYRIDDWGKYISQNSAQLISLAERVNDDYSRFTLFSVLLSHLTCNPEWSLHAAKPYLSLYFRSGLFVPGEAERFADCGASIAESAKAFMDAVDGRFDKIWMIEPDEINRKTLSDFIDEHHRGYPQEGGSLELIGCALGEAQGEMPFLHEGGHGGHLLPVSSGLVQCRNVAVCRLDDILDSPPTLIKMDIEGAELGALKGARGHIEQGRPKLAISAYHRPSDLLDLVNFVDGLRGDYRVGVRHHTEERWDTCLYFY